MEFTSKKKNKNKTQLKQQHNFAYYYTILDKTHHEKFNVNDE